MSGRARPAGRMESAGLHGNVLSHLSQHQLSRRTLLGGLLGTAAGVGLQCAIPSAIAGELKSQRKQLLIINHSGGLSQLESWDPKPGTDTGGPLSRISTSVPGIQISEWLPYTAQQVHRLTILRSLSTGENDHGPGHYLMMTGRRIQTGFLYPTLPCWTHQAVTPAAHPVPGYISIGGGDREAAFLGVQYDPVKVLVGKPLDNVDRPASISEESSLRRLMLRQRINGRFLKQRVTADTAAYSQSFEQAVQLVRNKTLFDLTQEPASDHDRYGRHEMGQQCLLARRLLQQGVTCVRVTHPGYDTHAENFNVHLDLLEQFDRPFACLIEDLAARGLLANTLVVCMGEFGRTPNINTRMGRDHWSGTWSAAFAGLSIPQGKVVGSTNDTGVEVVDTKVTSPDLFHSLLTVLGIDPTQKLSVEGQEIPLADPAGIAVTELLG